MKTFVCTLIGCLMFAMVAAPPPIHGNNPTFQWYGVSFGGSELVPIDGGTYNLLEALYPGGLTTANGTALDCGELSLLICGDGEVCCVCSTGDSCSFSCRDIDGDCAPCPQCGNAQPYIGTS